MINTQTPPNGSLLPELLYKAKKVLNQTTENHHSKCIYENDETYRMADKFCLVFNENDFEIFELLLCEENYSEKNDFISLFENLSAEELEQFTEKLRTVLFS
jgi:DNA-directed RNA polymerase subunit F